MTTYSWDSAIPESAQQESRNFPVAVAGTYSFEVEKADKASYSGQGKLPQGTPTIKLQLRVEGKDASGKDVEVKVFENLYFAEKTYWKAASFAKAIGIHHEGMLFAEIADKAVGNIGEAVFEVHEYNGSKSNRVKSFIEKKEVKVDASELPF